jgi:hypothetical protein
VVNPRWAPLLKDNPFIDRLVLFSRHSWAGIREAWRGLRAQKYDFAVDFQGLMQSALVATAARPTRIYGFHQSQLREPLAGLIYSDRVLSESAHVGGPEPGSGRSRGAATCSRRFTAGRNTGRRVAHRRFVLASPWRDGAPNSGRWSITRPWHIC